MPATSITAIVSPKALPTPNTTAANTPDFAAGNTTLNIVSIFDAPSANEPSLYAFGTALIAVSDTDIIVGNIITASTITIANKLCPFGRLNILCIVGTITARPNTPYNTEGIPAKSSTAGDIIFANLLGATSAINTEVNIPTGTPITSAPSVANIDATIIDDIPNLLAEGTQSAPVKKSINEYPSNINGLNPL
ncbi:hypothetical protein BN168_650096 [Clostridioides difficile CD002]|nr:hypothetical protein BN168_650096 [Clostridioides difficile CD002]